MPVALSTYLSYLSFFLVNTRSRKLLSNLIILYILFSKEYTCKKKKEGGVAEVVGQNLIRRRRLLAVCKDSRGSTASQKTFSRERNGGSRIPPFLNHLPSHPSVKTRLPSTRPFSYFLFLSFIYFLFFILILIVIFLLTVSINK